jgi:hypothetical protein
MWNHSHYLHQLPHFQTLSPDYSQAILIILVIFWGDSHPLCTNETCENMYSNIVLYIYFTILYIHVYHHCTTNGDLVNYCSPPRALALISPCHITVRPLCIVLVRFFLESYVPCTIRPLHVTSLARYVPCTIRLLHDASLARYVHSAAGTITGIANYNGAAMRESAVLRSMGGVRETTFRVTSSLGRFIQRKCDPRKNILGRYMQGRIVM